MKNVKSDQNTTLVIRRSINEVMYSKRAFLFRVFDGGARMPVAYALCGQKEDNANYRGPKAQPFTGKTARLPGVR